MSRRELLEDVRTLIAMVERANKEEVNRAQADSRRSHIDLQITRLEEAALKVERRLLECDSDHVLPSEEQLLEAERAELSARLSGIQDKIVALKASGAASIGPPADARTTPPGAKARLRAVLRELVGELRADAAVPRAEIQPFQRRLAELVRERRDELTTIAERLEDARDYVVAALDGLGPIADAVETMADADLPAGVEIPLPFERERGVACTRVEMARLAVREALASLRSLAHDWPELDELSGLDDWAKLPFRPLMQLLLPAEGTLVARRPTTINLALAKQMLEVRDTARGLALWLDELRQRVEQTPPPG